MYESHFSLTHCPFSSTPDPAAWLEINGTGAVRADLRRCLDAGRGLAVLTAPAGLGKTITCRKVVDDLSGDFATVFLATAHFPTRRSLLQAILYELGRPYSTRDTQELRLELTTAARECRRMSRGLVLAIDEAHLLEETLLEEVRGIATLIDGQGPLVRVLLSGLLLLEERLAAPGLEAFNQRIASHQTLEQWSRLESAEFISRRLEWAGATGPAVFTGEALQLICQASDGVPRCLNLLCDRSLSLAAELFERPVPAATVRRSLEELKRLPLAWNDCATREHDQMPSADDGGLESLSHALKEWPTQSDSLELEHGGCDSVIEVGEAACLEVGGHSSSFPAEPGRPDSKSSPRFAAEEAESRPTELFVDCEFESDAAWSQPDADDPPPMAILDAPDNNAQPGERVWEVVWDRYALVDAGIAVSEAAESIRHHPVHNSGVLPEVADLRREEARIASIERVSHHSTSPDRDAIVIIDESPTAERVEAVVADDPRPDLAIEEVLPLLQSAIGPNQISASTDKHAVASDVRRRPAKAASFGGSSFYAAAGRTEEVETQLDSLVQEARGAFRGDPGSDAPAAASDSWPTQRVPVRYDVVQPVEDEHHGGCGVAVPHLAGRRYGRLFSRLRKGLGDAAGRAGNDASSFDAGEPGAERRVNAAQVGKSR